VRKRYVSGTSAAPDDYFREIEQRLATGVLPSQLGHRFRYCEGRGIVGWQDTDTDSTFTIWDAIPSESTIQLADEFARELESQEAFFELYEIAFGGPGTWFVTWILEKTVSWAAGRGLDLLFEKLKSPRAIELAERLKQTSEFRNQDGKLYIRIQPDADTILQEIVVEVVGYPAVAKSIAASDIGELKAQIISGQGKNFVYSKSGKFIEGSCGGKEISIEV
jgi:hypothetical protein